jgi:NADP-dependent 3-hydroxy acid dehydrogenase YdfG
VIEEANVRGRHAIVTGASSGMGLGIAQALAQAGYQVMLIGRTAERLAHVVETLRAAGHSVQSRAIDVKDATAMAEAYDAASDDDGRLSVAVHAAGVLYPRSIAESDVHDWEDTIGTNVLGVMFGSHCALKRMSHGDHIINISSVSGRQPSLIAAYCASKYAVTGFTECLRREASPLGIRVTCLEPGVAWTDFNRNMPGDFQQERRDADSLTIEDVAQVVMSLVSLPDHIDIGEVVVRHVAQVF